GVVRRPGRHGLLVLHHPHHGLLRQREAAAESRGLAASERRRVSHLKNLRTLKTVTESCAPRCSTPSRHLLNALNTVVLRAHGSGVLTNDTVPRGRHRAPPKTPCPRRQRVPPKMGVSQKVRKSQPALRVVPGAHRSEADTAAAEIGRGGAGA